MSRKIKILHTIRQGKIGGGESHVLDLVKGLDKNYFESVILSFTNGPMVDMLRQQGFKVLVLETTKPFDYKIWPEVKKILEHEKIQLLHAHGTRANSNTFSSAKKLGIPIIYTVHGWSFHQGQNKLIKFIRTKSEAFLVKKANLTICVSNSNLQDGKKHFNMQNAIVIKNGVNQEKFNPFNQYHNVRRELGISEDCFLAGFIGRITYQKDPFTLINAIAKIPEHYNIKFLMVGDGDLKQDTIELAQKLNVVNRIYFEGFRQDIPAVLNSLDAFCLPSLWEGLPIAVLEAMAMKKAVVATAVDGTKEIITNLKNGMLISTKDAEALAKSIIELYNDSTLRTSIATNGYDTIIKNYDIKSMINNIEDAYKNYALQ